MIKLPDFHKAFQYENDYYLSCDTSRLGKFIIQYEVYKRIEKIPGVVVECGVFKGTSLVRFAGFRELLGQTSSRTVIAFDTFAGFPKTKFTRDKRPRQRFISEAGDQSISLSQMRSVLRRKNSNHRVELVAGDINQTVPFFVKSHPRLQIALLNLDVDLFEPAVTVLHYLYPRIVPGGIMLLDDYGVFPGETKAVDEYFRKRKLQLSMNKFSFAKTPVWVVKK